MENCQQHDWHWFSRCSCVVYHGSRAAVSRQASIRSIPAVQVPGRPARDLRSAPSSTSDLTVAQQHSCQVPSSPDRQHLQINPPKQEGNALSAGHCTSLQMGIHSGKRRREQQNPQLVPFQLLVLVLLPTTVTTASTPTETRDQQPVPAHTLTQHVESSAAANATPHLRHHCSHFVIMDN